jgi:NTP pyrophosphatase (non-canonical NTP hydrolase)
VSRRPLDQLLAIMARLRGPRGCPWDRQQDHRSLRYHAVEEVYELLEAIEAGDDDEIAEELGDLLLHIVFHCQLGRERGAFDFRHVTRRLVNKLIHRQRRHAPPPPSGRNGTGLNKRKSTAPAPNESPPWTACLGGCRPCCGPKSSGKRQSGPGLCPNPKRALAAGLAPPLAG